MKVISRNLQQVREKVAEACVSSGRNSEDVRLVAVTKTVGVDVIRALLDLGVRDIGENRVEVAEEKIPEIGRNEATWHMIGHIQSRKARRVVENFDLVHSVDSEKLAGKMSRAPEESGRRMECLLEVNMAGEEQKAGFSPDQVMEIFPKINDLAGLKVTGLMTMAPFIEPEDTRVFFRKLRELRDRIQEKHRVELPELSMGMSNDYPQAVSEGATIIRVGTRLYKGLEI